MKSFLTENKTLAWLWTILVANFILGIITLNLSPIAMDEPFSIFHAQMDIGDIVSNLQGGNNPPLYEIVLHFWIKVFGISPISVRFPSLLFSIGTLFFTFKIANSITGTKDAFLAILLMSFSNYYINITHEARAYSLFLLLTVLLIYLVTRISKHKESKNAEFIAYGLVAILLLYTHYFGLFVFFFQSLVFVFINRKEKTVLLKFLLTSIGTIILFSPYMTVIYSRFMVSSINGTWVQATENLGNLHDMIHSFANKNRYCYATLVILLYGSIWKTLYLLKIFRFASIVGRYFLIPLFFLISMSIFYDFPFIWRLTKMDLVTNLFVAIPILLFVYLSMINRKSNTFKLLIIGSFLIPLFFFFKLSFYIPVWIDRYLIFILPSFYITIAIANQFLFQGTRYYLSSIILVVIMFFSFDITTPDHKDVSKMISYVKAIATDKSKIVINPKHFDLTFSYHFDQSVFSNHVSFSESMESKGIYSIYNISELKRIQNKSGDHIIYVDAHSDFLYPNNGVYKRLCSSYELKDEKIFDKNIRVCEFVKKVH